MNKLLVQLGLLMACVALVTGCTQEGSLPGEEEKDAFFDPLPAGLPVFAEVVEPYLNISSSDSEALALFSYKPMASETDVAQQTEIFTAESDIVVTLNTQTDDGTQADKLGRSEFTLLVKNDSVYVVNHTTNEIRLLSHFINDVCEIIPTERVEDTTVDKVDPITSVITQERVLTVLHKELVYVLTKEAVEGKDTCSSEGAERFYALPLNHQLDPSLDEDGQLDSLELVKESVARSELIFGWVPDPDNSGQDKMVYAYLGFDGKNQELSLFDETRQVVWTQARTLQTFDVVEIEPNQFTSKYLFYVKALDNQQYIIQLGLDVFVVDSGLELISKAFNETESILTDKVLTISSNSIVDDSETLEYALPVVSENDDDDLFFVDGAKIYHHAYQDNVPARNPSQSTTIVPQNALMIDDKHHVLTRKFSQFDLIKCADNDTDCIAAHDVDAQNWQFFTPCESQFGCSMSVTTVDNCETVEENQQTQSDAPICSASDYQHLAELNEDDNDADFQAFMQYRDDFVRYVDFILHNDKLIVTAKMNQKDVFLTYNFNADFNAPKSVREQALFGKRASLTGMVAHIANDNLFLTALQKGALRSNECYKNYQKVTCQLSELVEEGNSNVCTGKDLQLGTCFNTFSEYESKALFCTEAQMDDLSCSDANLTQIDDLAVESSGEDAKWLELVDYANNSITMRLLVGDHTLALDTQNLDEGKLFMPDLYKVDHDTGVKGELIASLEGVVESVVGGWMSKEPEVGESGVYAHIGFISDEVVQNGGASNQTDGRLTTYLLEQTYGSLPVPDTKKVSKVAERLFQRF